MEIGSREKGMEEIRVQRIDLMLYCCAGTQRAHGYPPAASTAAPAGWCELITWDSPPDF